MPFTNLEAAQTYCSGSLALDETDVENLKILRMMLLDAAKSNKGSRYLGPNICSTSEQEHGCGKSSLSFPINPRSFLPPPRTTSTDKYQSSSRTRPGANPSSGAAGATRCPSGVSGADVLGDPVREHVDGGKGTSSREGGDENIASSGSGHPQPHIAERPTIDSSLVDVGEPVHGLDRVDEEKGGPDRDGDDEHGARGRGHSHPHTDQEETEADRLKRVGVQGWKDDDERCLGFLDIFVISPPRPAYIWNGHKSIARILQCGIGNS